MAIAVKATFIAILLVVTTIDALPVQQIPDFLHVCDTKDENFESCVVDSIEYLQPYLKTGVPEYNIPSLEPLQLKQLQFAPTSTLRIGVSNISVHDSSNYRISNFKADLDKLLFFVDVSLANLRVEGEYDMSGKVLLLPIHGNGGLRGNFTDCIGSCKIHLEKFVDDNGVEKTRLKDFKIKIHVSKGTLQLDNLFGGERALGEVINSAINNNLDLFLKEILPLFEKGLTDAFWTISDNIVTQFEFSQLFPNM